MSARGEARLWLAQRASAAVLAVAVLVHLGTIIFAVRGGLSAAEIITRVQGNGAWLAFYLIFVAAIAIHAPIGLRTVLTELTPLRGRTLDTLMLLAAVALAVFGARAAIALYAFGPG